MNVTTTPVALPQDIDEIDGTFLTAALAARHPGTIVREATVVDLRQGSASSLTLHLAYDENPDELARSMFLKGDFIDHEFTSPVAFSTEAHFYDRLAEQIDSVVTIPTGYFGGVDADGQAIVLLEDLSLRDVRFNDPTVPLAIDVVATGVEQLARLHATFWDGRGLEDQDWLDKSSSIELLMRYLVQPDHFDDYINRPRAAGIPDALKDREAVEHALVQMFATDLDVPTTLVHGDPHIGNTWTENGAIGFYDWQGAAIGPYLWDVTYFLTGALSVEDRRASERDLLILYRDGLTAAGIDAPSSDQLWLGHRRHLMHGYLSILTPDQMQPDEFAVSVGERFAHAAVDLETLAAF